MARAPLDCPGSWLPVRPGPGSPPRRRAPPHLWGPLVGARYARGIHSQRLGDGPSSMQVRLGFVVAGLAAQLLGCDQSTQECLTFPYDCPCEAGHVMCHGGPGFYYCSDLQKEPNCGACNTVCGSGSCVAGACVCAPPPVGSCPPPPGGGGEISFMPPWTVCRDLTTDPNCGGCGIACGQGSCVSGACVCAAPPVKACPPPSPLPTYSWTICRDITTDGNCGDCGIHCGYGSCVSGTCVCDPPPVKACPPPDPIPATGYAVCRDVTSDPWNCGDCGIACTSLQRCVAGRCQ